MKGIAVNILRELPAALAITIFICAAVYAAAGLTLAVPA